MPDKIILLDMDGVIVDYEQGFLNAWREKHPELPFIPLEQRTTFYPRDQYPKDLAEEIVNSKGFYRNLPPMPGFLEAIFKLQDKTLVLRACLKIKCQINLIFIITLIDNFSKN